MFLVADGIVKLSGGGQVFRKSSSKRDYPARGEEHNDDLRGESDGSQPLDTPTDDGEARNDFWTMMPVIFRHHVEQRVITVCRKKNIMNIALQERSSVAEVQEALDVTCIVTSDNSSVYSLLLGILKNTRFHGFLTHHVWRTCPICSLEQQHRCHSVIFDQCAFGTPWKLRRPL